MRTRTVCTTCLQPAEKLAGVWFHVRDLDTLDCPRFDDSPIRVHVVRLCDIGVCDRLADVNMGAGRALCAGHAYGQQVVERSAKRNA